MKPLTLLTALLFAAQLFAQPAQTSVAIDPVEEQYLLESKDSIYVPPVSLQKMISIDGEIDDLWNNVSRYKLNSTIKYYTAYENGAYLKKSMIDDGDNTRRVSNGTDDFSGSFTSLWNNYYLYFLIDIVDDEVNDGVKNPGTNEEIILYEAPYSNNAQDILKGASYPPYSGIGHIGSEGAKDRNLKYCYWNYLGAFQIVFKLMDAGKCEASIRQETDALAKIPIEGYTQREEACLCAWKHRTDGKSGYIAEVGISFKVTMADSANNPYSIPDGNSGVVKHIAFEMNVMDRDLGKKALQASWKAEDNNIWDAMLWCSKLIMGGFPCPPWYPEGITPSKYDIPTFSPNPASTQINFEENISLIEIYSLDGRLQIKQQHTNTVNVSTLPSGMYVVKGDGMVLGKMVKE